MTRRSHYLEGGRVSAFGILVTLAFVVAACVPESESTTTSGDTTPTTSGETTTTSDPVSSTTTNPVELDCSGFVDFEDLSVGATFLSGDVFVSGGVDVEVADFEWDDGTMFGGGEAVVMAAGLAGGSGNEVFTNNVLLRFGFPTAPLNGLVFDFGAHGGNLNIEINGDFVNFGSMSAIDGTSIGGVAVSVGSMSSGGIGSLELTGTISDFAIGGQEFAIDNLCGRSAG